MASEMNKKQVSELFNKQSVPGEVDGLHALSKEVKSERIQAERHSGVKKKPFTYRFIKRAFDILFSTCVIIVGIIPGIVLSLFIIVDTKGTPIYTQTRVGRNGKPFKIYKFRSMIVDSDNVDKYFTPEQLETWKRERKVENDPRVTKLGNVIRKTSIDEFPQFINVWLGQISIIGCRAITYDELEWFGEDRELLLSVPPGITGLWQTGPRNLATFENGLRQQFELSYVKNASVTLDAKIFFRTFRVMLARTGQ